MLQQPATKYRPFAPIGLKDRTWPDAVLTKPPIWLSTDLRDGNQSLIEPMSVERKLELFQLLVDIGFKEIEVSFPSASQTEFNFVRRLIDENRIPDDVSIQVLTQAREGLIRRTIESLAGVKKAIVHVYNPCAPVMRKVVLGLDEDGITDTEVLVPAGASPHDYSLKPSDVQKLKSAEMVVWIGEDVDAFLDKSIDDLDYKKVLTIKDIAAIEPFLLKGEHHHHHHGEGEGNGHRSQHHGEGQAHAHRHGQGGATGEGRCPHRGQGGHGHGRGAHQQ